MSEINLLNANNLKSTNESKIETLKKLSKKEQSFYVVWKVKQVLLFQVKFLKNNS